MLSRIETRGEFDGRSWSSVRRGFERISGMLRTRDGSVWVASNSGLHRYFQGAWVENGVEEGLPSTGMPTRTSQGDLAFASNIGHGDSDSLILLPGSINECFEFGWKSFDIAERLQTPVFVLSDLDMGMNQWMSKPFEYPDVPMDRGKILWEKDLEQLKGNWARYLDTDGDGIPFRTVPGNRHPMSAYFTRGTGHDENARYTEDSNTWVQMMDRLKKKFELGRKYMPKPILHSTPDATIGIISFGSTESAVLEAMQQLDIQHGIKADFLRVRSIPFTDEVTEFIGKYDQVFVVEMNRDGQMKQILTIEYPDKASSLKSVAFGDGMPASARWIREGIHSRYAVSSTADLSPVSK
jgi:2-oxoglutarate ferredoxin oxidoreductase subunit alpha